MGGVDGCCNKNFSIWGTNVSGVMGFVSDHVGLRGDVRYFRDFQNTSSTDHNVDLSNLTVGSFDFWRGTVGLAFRW